MNTEKYKVMRWMFFSPKDEIIKDNITLDEAINLIKILTYNSDAYEGFYYEKI